MKSVNVRATLEGVMATTDVTLTYYNNYEQPIECTYEFPLEKTTLLSKLVIKLGDQVIHAKVDRKEEAKQTYEEAIKAKNTAVLAERKSEEKEVMSVKIGQLQAGAQATLEVQLIHVMEIVSGAYCY